MKKKIILEFKYNLKKKEQFYTTVNPDTQSIRALTTSIQ